MFLSRMTEHREPQCTTAMRGKSIIDFLDLGNGSFFYCNWERSNLHKRMLDGATAVQVQCIAVRRVVQHMDDEARSGLFTFMVSRASGFVISWLVNVASASQWHGVREITGGWSRMVVSDNLIDEFRHTHLKWVANFWLDRIEERLNVFYNHFLYL